MLYVTGDTHGEEGRFLYKDSEIDCNLTKRDKLFICGDFGYVSDDSYRERQFLKFLAQEKPYQILFVDGNHENFDLLESYPVEEWCGGKVHVIRSDKEGTPKIIHLMRGQVFEIEGKKIFTFGGAYSIDKYMRREGISWWPQEMPSDEEMDEAVRNLEKHNYKVDFILTHAAPEETMSMFHPYHPNEQPLNGFLEWVREQVDYKHWYFGHLHREEDLWRNQTVLWFQVRNMRNNRIVTSPKISFDSYIVADSNRFAYTASKAVAESPGEVYNPLLLYGPNMTGKTHLMKAIQAVVEKERLGYNVVYMCGDDFAQLLVETIVNKDKTSLDELMQADVLLLDHVQFWAGKVSMQEEIFAVLREMIDQGKQVVLASDRPFEELDILYQRLQTRFSTTLTADLDCQEEEIQEMLRAEHLTL